MKGVRWVRLFYLYPETIDEALVELLASHPRVVPYVDMPLQHAADAMLKRMRRGHGKDRQKRVVERLRKAIPGLTFRTAFIVGHPGETAGRVRRARASSSSGRASSTRSSSATRTRRRARAHALAGKVPALVAANRARKLMALQRRIAREKNRALVGRELDVLVEGPSEEHELVMKGRHAGQAPDIDGSVYLSEGEAHAGEMRRVRIVAGERLGPRRRAAGRAAPKGAAPGASRSRCSAAAAASRAGSSDAATQHPRRRSQAHSSAMRSGRGA